MLRPQDNGIRESRKLDGVWQFRVDTDNVGRDEAWWQGRLPDARPVAMPSSYNDLFVDPSVKHHVGDVWYQLSTHIPAGWADRRIRLRFDAATHRADVWVNGVHVAHHEGGYMPFEAGLEHVVGPGDAAHITIVVNNELSFESIPPGVVQDNADGSRTQRYYHDFFNFAGLHRSVWLHSTPTTHVEDLTVETDLDGTTGIVRCATTIVGTGEVTLRLVDTDGTTVAEGPATTPELRVENARIWGPGRGELYDLVVEIHDGDEVVDRFVQPVGIRTVEVRGTQFLINGEPFHFRGFGMHEDQNVRGKGWDAASMIHEFALLQWTGANSFRTSHYPYAEEVLDHADRLGLVVIDETAAVGLNLAIGGGFFMGGQHETFTEETIGSTAQAVHRAAVEELIARDKNHPSVVLWCIANEPESHTDASVDYFTPLFDRARELDPTRPVGFVNVMLAGPDTCKLAALGDVLMLNRYYGWYMDSNDLVAAEANLERELQAWADHGKPIVLTEYGADTIPGFHEVNGDMWTEEFQARMLDTYHRVFDRIDAVVGEQVWNFADFATTASFMRVGGNKKGVFTRDRKPKAAAYLLRDRWTNA